MKTHVRFIKNAIRLFGAFLLLSVSASKAQNFSIQFAANGMSSTVDSVFVKNLTQGTSARLAGTDVLKLIQITTGTTSVSEDTKESLFVFPNPALNGNCSALLKVAYAQNAMCEIVDVSGRVLYRKSVALVEGSNAVELKNVPKGICFVNIATNDKLFSGKTISFEATSANVEIVDHSISVSSFNVDVPAKVVAAYQQEITMDYRAGDYIQLKGKSENYADVFVFTPTKNDVVSFVFYDCTDGDGNHYPTVKIGNQIWMAENLRTTNYNDGTSIDLVEDTETWFNQDTVIAAYCWYNNDIQHKYPYGALYNWNAAISEKIVPKGWHLPSEDDYIELIGSHTYDSRIFISGSPAYWESLSVARYDSTGFSAVGAGQRSWGSFSEINNYTQFWTSSKAPMASIRKKDMNEGVQKSPTADFYAIAASFDPLRADIFSVNPNTGLSIRCIKNSPPKVETRMMSNTRSTAVGCEGYVTDNGGETLTERGICLSSTNTEPTVNDIHVPNADVFTGLFSCSVSDLTANTTYYVRAYATNSIGTGYGEVKTIKTLDLGTITDVEGNTYNIVKIGDQFWLAEDLRTSKFNDGTAIPLMVDAANWSTNTTSAYSMYNNVEPEDSYGYLYNQYAIQTNKLAPIGWHIPTKTEFDVMREGLTSDPDEEDFFSLKLKEAGAAHWMEGLANGTNFSGFTALPGGYRNTSGVFAGRGSEGRWWTTDDYPGMPSYYRSLYLSDGAWASADSMNCGLAVRCLKDYPAVVTTFIKNVTQTTVSLGVDVFSGGGTILRKGICWSSGASVPTIDNSAVIELTPGYGAAWQELAELAATSTYSVRAFAENSTGISYGEVITFNTQSATTVKDVDGNEYHTIKIGTQTWMVENLKTTRLNDGTALPVIWGYAYKTPGYSTYGNNSANRTTYGLLYNWYAVDTGKLAPEGWRVPTEDDWKILINYLGGFSDNGAGGKLKETGTLHWASPNGNALDYGFTALPGGRRDGMSAYFMHLRYGGYWWSRSVSSGNDLGSGFQLNYYGGNASLYTDDKYTALSVRCLKNDE